MGIEEEIAELEKERDELIKKLDLLYSIIDSLSNKAEILAEKRKLKALVKSIAEIDIKIVLLENLIKDENQEVQAVTPKI